MYSIGLCRPAALSSRKFRVVARMVTTFRAAEPTITYISPATARLLPNLCSWTTATSQTTAAISLTKIILTSSPHISTPLSMFLTLATKLWTAIFLHQDQALLHAQPTTGTTSFIIAVHDFPMEQLLETEMELVIAICLPCKHGCLLVIIICHVSLTFDGKESYRWSYIYN